MQYPFKIAMKIFRERPHGYYVNDLIRNTVRLGIPTLE
jgi:hypothetical protein